MSKNLDEMLGKCKDPVEVGGGGQRTVYKAAHPEYGQIVIKHRKYASRTGFDRMVREAQILKAQVSLCFPRFHDLIDFPVDGECLSIEEYIEGDELAKRMSDYDSEKEISIFLGKIVACMSNMWPTVIHRDLKPENIIIRANNGNPCIIDFGIARALVMDSLTDDWAGTGPHSPLYTAPEQIRNRKAEIDFRSDLFALGIICLEMHISKHPFDPSNAGGTSVRENILSGNYVRPESEAGTSADFAEMIHRLLAIRPYGRYRRVDDLHDQIAKIQ